MDDHDLAILKLRFWSVGGVRRALSDIRAIRRNLRQVDEIVLDSAEALPERLGPVLLDIIRTPDVLDVELRRRLEVAVLGPLREAGTQDEVTRRMRTILGDDDA